MTSVLPKIDPSYIHASDVELLVKAKDFLYAESDIPQPHKETYICYAIQKAAGMENITSLYELSNWETAEGKAVVRLTIMVQMALVKHRKLNFTELDIQTSVSTSYGSLDEYSAKYNPWDPAMRVHRHAWLDYMIATCKAHFNQ